MGDNLFPKRRNWHSGTNYIFLPSHFCICLEMQRRIAIVAIWNNCDRSVLSVLVVPVHQNRTHKLMHHAFKTWCIVSTNSRYAIKMKFARSGRASFLLFVIDGFERRLLAGCRWHAATAVAFPQKSKSCPCNHVADEKRISTAEPTNHHGLVFFSYLKLPF